VGLLRPNDLGLFDVHGNGYEWCQDRKIIQKEAEKGKPNKEDLEDIVDFKSYRQFRSSWFASRASGVRSANLVIAMPPTARSGANGFRPARTFR
jgi:formylglycine-generating enzyme required for sulfatase activity